MSEHEKKSHGHAHAPAHPKPEWRDAWNAKLREMQDAENERARKNGEKQGRTIHATEVTAALRKK